MLDAKPSNLDSLLLSVYLKLTLSWSKGPGAKDTGCCSLETASDQAQFKERLLHEILPVPTTRKCDMPQQAHVDHRASKPCKLWANGINDTPLHDRYLICIVSGRLKVATQIVRKKLLSQHRMKTQTCSSRSSNSNLEWP